MFSQHSQRAERRSAAPQPHGVPALARALGLCLALCFCVHCAAAASITNVTAVNVTPAGFTILWRAPLDSTSSISVYADPGGLTNLAGQLGLEALPLSTGNPALAAGYERRLGQAALRQRTLSYGLMQMRVTGCQPGTSYYYRLTSTPSGGAPAVYPPSGPLPAVTTENENTFVLDARQILIEVPGVDTEGRVVVLSHPNAAHPLAAVIGDGVGTNQVIFNLCDLFNLAGGGNFTPLGSQEFTADVWGPGHAEEVAAFTVVFGTNLTVAQSTLASYGTEFLALTIGSVILRAGQTGSVPLNFNSSVGLTNLEFFLDLPAGHLTNFTLAGLPAEVDPASATVTPQGGTTWVLHLTSRSGQTMVGVKEIAQFTFTAISNVPSAFVPLKLGTIRASKTDASLVANLYGQSGRVVVVGNEPLLEAAAARDGSRQLTLYGKPWFSYAIECSTNLANAGGWQQITHFPLTNLVTLLSGISGSQDSRFYRALEFTPNPPVVDALLAPDQTRSLLAYGLPGAGYQVQSTTNLSGVVTWTPVLNYSLSNSFRYLTLPAGTNTIFYKAQKQ
jgi:hypothetical protein